LLLKRNYIYNNDFKGVIAIMEFFITLLLGTLPEQFINIMWGATLFGYRFNIVKSQALKMAIFISIVSEILWHFEGISDTRIFITFLITFISFKLFFNQTLGNSLIMLLSGYLSALISEIAVVLILTKFIDLQDILNSQFLKILVTYLYSTPLLIGIWWFHKKNISIQKIILFKLRDKKVIFYLATVIIFSVLQIFLLIFLGYAFYIQNTQLINQKIIFDIYGLPLIGFILFILNIVVIIFVVKIKNYNQQQEINKYQDSYYENINQLIITLRGERHDYINQLQTIYGMLQVNMIDQLKEYVNSLVGQVETINHSIKIKNIPVSAMLYAKSSEIQSKGVKFNIYAETEDSFLSIKEYDLVKVISNLLDNALRAVTEAEIINPTIDLIWQRKESVGVISVSNNGPKIEKKILNFIFKEGFTTKKSNNNGYGLAIIKMIVEEKYNGSIKVISTDQITKFTIELPL